MVKAFWVVCFTGFAVYVAYTSVGMVVQYYTQDIVMEVVYEIFTTLPETKICLSGSIDVDRWNTDLENLHIYRGSLI